MWRIERPFERSGRLLSRARGAVSGSLRGRVFQTYIGVWWREPATRARTVETRRPALELELCTISAPRVSTNTSIHSQPGLYGSVLFGLCAHSKIRSGNATKGYLHYGVLLNECFPFEETKWLYRENS